MNGNLMLLNLPYVSSSVPVDQISPTSSNIMFIGPLPEYPQRIRVASVFELITWLSVCLCACKYSNFFGEVVVSLCAAASGGRWRQVTFKRLRDNIYSIQWLFSREAIDTTSGGRWSHAHAREMRKFDDRQTIKQVINSKIINYVKKSRNLLKKKMRKFARRQTDNQVINSKTEATLILSG